MNVEAILDTSVFIAVESGRPLDRSAIPDAVGISAITVGELRAGVLAAPDPATADTRLSTLLLATRVTPVPIDEQVAFAWARLRIELAAAKRAMPANDSWIAATAIALEVPVVAQDADYDGVPRLDVIRA